MLLKKSVVIQVFNTITLRKTTYLPIFHVYMPFTPFLPLLFPELISLHISWVEAETKKLIAACCQQHDLTLLATRTDMDHVHVFVSAPPRLSPSTIAGTPEGYTSRYLREKSHISRNSAGKSICGQVS